MKKFKKVIANILTEKTGVDIPTDRITSIEYLPEGCRYRVIVKNPYLEEGYEYESVTFHEVFMYLAEKSNSNFMGNGRCLDM
jgi:uncharacterized cysteine cluster protein YcgN (CxxCxxCC family)